MGNRLFDRTGIRVSALGLGVLLLSGCSGQAAESTRPALTQTGGIPVVTAVIPAALPPGTAALLPPSSQAALAESFEDWLAGFRRTAEAAGIARSTLDRALTGLGPDDQIVRADRNQPEFERPTWAYLDSAVSDSRIGAGRSRLAEHGAALARVERQYGVQAPYIVAFWAVESN